MRVSEDFLRKMQDEKAPGTWIAQPKYDGWRRPAYKADGRWRFHAKRGTGDEAKRTPPPDVAAALDALALPDGTALDAEWMGPRDIYGKLAGRNYLVVFDMPYHGGVWQGAVPFAERLASMTTLIALARAKAGKAAELVQVAPSADRGWHDYFAQQKQDPLTEGVVLKEACSLLVGDLQKARDNGGWYKVKYRDIHEATKF
jgi:ATP-dependent DNA ligase